MKSCARWWRVFNLNCTVKQLFGQISHGNGDKYPTEMETNISRKWRQISHGNGDNYPTEMETNIPRKWRQIFHGNGDKYPLKTTGFEKLHVFYCETNATCASFSIPTENHVDR